MNAEHNPTAEEYKDAAHYWQTKWAATEQRFQEATETIQRQSEQLIKNHRIFSEVELRAEEFAEVLADRERLFKRVAELEGDRKGEETDLEAIFNEIRTSISSLPIEERVKLYKRVAERYRPRPNAID